MQEDLIEILFFCYQVFHFTVTGIVLRLIVFTFKWDFVSMEKWYNLMGIQKNGYVKRLSEPELIFERVNASAEFIGISCLICIFLFEFGVLLVCYLFNASRENIFYPVNQLKDLICVKYVPQRRS